MTVSVLIGAPIPNNAVESAKFYGRSNHTVIRVYDAGSNVMETHEHKVYPHGIVKYIMVRHDQNAT